MHDPFTLQQIDACRPRNSDAGSDDAREPELEARLAADERVRELYDRVQQTDEAIQTAIGDVPVPPDLADGVMAALKAAENGEDPI